MDSMLSDQDFIKSLYKFNPELLSFFSPNTQNPHITSTLIEHKQKDIFQTQTIDFDPTSNLCCTDTDADTLWENTDFSEFHRGGFDSPDVPKYSNEDVLGTENDSYLNLPCNVGSDIPDFPDDCLKFLSDILLEEDLDQTQNPSSSRDFSALQATEKSLYDALCLNQSPSSITNTTTTTSYDTSNSHSINDVIDSFLNVDEISKSLIELNSSDNSSNNSSGSTSPVSTLTNPTTSSSKPTTRRKKSRPREKDSTTQGINLRRTSKIQATSNEDYVEMEQFDDVVLLCNYKDKIPIKINTSKPTTQSDQVDLTTLLLQCANAVSSFDPRNASELLKQIRQHATPYGDSIQRLAHHAGNALEARLAGTGGTISTNLTDVRISVSDFLRAYRLYVSCVPFKRMFYFQANCTIAKLAETARSIHIIDFGVFLGLQWPCLIQSFSKLPNGPPKLRITGIEYPQQGFRPAERIEATGKRLSGYCKRFGVPFEYRAIAQNWDTIKLDDLKIKSDEMVIVNCMGRSTTLLDETVDQTNSQKDGFLRLVRSLNPRLFVHGVFNGTLNAPFFVTRFREALFHYSSVFDVFDATIPRESHERLLVESEIYGKELYNVIACEGVERVQRPESYKQWQVRSVRAGLRQVGLDQELFSRAKSTVKAYYHKEFVVDQDRDWMLQGWKGRTLCALSFWEPA